MNIQKQRKRHHKLNALAFGLLIGGCFALPTQAKDTKPADKEAEPALVDLFDAIDQDLVDAKFVARDATRGRLVLTNKTEQPVRVLIPDAFAGVPVLHQFGGGGGGGRGGGGGGRGGGGGGGGGQQSVGGGGGGGLGGGGGGGQGGGGGGFNIAPEKIGVDIAPDKIRRVDIPLLCLNHGLRDPSSSKPYEVRPIEDVVDSPALIQIIKGYSSGQLPYGASQAAAWHINSDVSWDELAAKLTGTTRSLVRNSYFNRGELQTAMAIVNRAETMTAGQQVVPRNWKSQSERAKEKAASEEGPVDESYEPKKGKVIDVEAELAESQDS